MRQNAHFSNNRFVIVSIGILTLFIAAATLLNHLSVLDALRMLGYQVFCMLVPGCALLHLIRFRCRSVIQAFGFSYAIGYCISLLTYIVSIPVSFLTGSWMLCIPVLNYIIAALSTVYVFVRCYLKKGSALTHEKTSQSDRLFSIVLWVCFFIICFLSYGLSNRLPNNGSSQAYYMDTLYWLGNALSLSRGFPPESIRGAGATIIYHYFSSMQLVSIEKTTGMSLAQIGLAYSYIQSATLLIFGFLGLFLELLHKKTTVFLAMVLLLLTMGNVDLTNNYTSSHLIYAPFGFDYGTALTGFALLLLFWQYKAKTLRWRYLALTIVLLGVCMGTKAPLGVLLLGFLGLMCLRWLFDAKKRRDAIILGAVSVILCAAVYLTFMANTAAWLKAGSSAASDAAASGGGLSLSWEGTSQYSSVVDQLYNEEYAGTKHVSKLLLVLKIVFQYSFYSNMAIVFLTLCSFIRLLYHLKESQFFQWACFIVSIVSLNLTLFLSMEGYSQCYFIQGAFVYATLLSFYSPENMLETHHSVLLLKKIVAYPLMIVCLLNTFLFLRPIISDSVYTIKTGELRLTSTFAGVLQSNIVTPAEAEGYEWIHENTDPDDILITNATVSSYSPMMTGIFTERRLWVESEKSPSVARAVADIRIADIENFYKDGSRAAYKQLKAGGVDYAIVLNRYKTGTEYTSHLECVFSNDEIEIYAMH